MLPPAHPAVPDPVALVRGLLVCVSCDRLELRHVAPCSTHARALIVYHYARLGALLFYFAALVVEPLSVVSDLQCLCAVFFFVPRGETWLRMLCLSPSFAFVLLPFCVLGGCVAFRSEVVFCFPCPLFRFCPFSVHPSLPCLALSCWCCGVSLSS